MSIQYHDAYKKAVHFLSQKERSIFETKQFLKKMDISTSIIQEIVEKLIENKYLSDERFADIRIYARIKKNLWGLEKVREELVSLEVDRTIISQKLSQIKEQIWIETGLHFIEKLNKTSKKKNDIEYTKNKLLQNGYSEEIIHSIIKNYLSE